uniref:Uncharacterized protein n=1 Tax=Lactuca sativa TaxID=4236 RepID=A0A9R1XFF7_LACSA|nr:hypothetical protein LSAT_V11C500289530 [Lactuca sativa]
MFFFIDTHKKSIPAIDNLLKLVTAIAVTDGFSTSGDSCASGNFTSHDFYIFLLLICAVFLEKSDEIGLPSWYVLFSANVDMG